MIQEFFNKEQNKPTSYPNVPKIAEKKCTACGQCTSVCLVFEKRNKQISIVRPELCISCGHCGSFCPSGAIKSPSTEPKRLTDADLAKMPSPASLQLLFRSRRSVRKYKKKPVSKKDINRILEAGRYTPTGTNTQGIQYIVIADPDRIAELRKMTLPAVLKLFGMAERIAALPFSSLVLGENFVYNIKNKYSPALELIRQRTIRGDDRLFYSAPAILLVHGEKMDDMAFSSAVALFNCSMMAHTLGLGCCLNGFLALAANQNSSVKKWLGIPRNHKCHGAITLGYPNVKYKSLVKRNPVNVRWL